MIQPILLLATALASPLYETAFWSHWGDGQAELSAYELTTPRYGEMRSGTAVCIFVSEDFSEELRVKADPGKHDQSQVYPVLKLNLIEDFSTGIYDYNLMTSSFVALAPYAGRPAGATSKVAFSSQEWCGQVYQQMIFHADRVEITRHSYFDGEADATQTLPLPEPTLAEDSLPLWARGLAWPTVGPGERVRIAMLRSAKFMRLSHREAESIEVTLQREATTTKLTLQGVEHEARLAVVRGPEAEMVARYWIEVAAPQRILRWERAGGEVAELLKSTRLKYWQLNGQGGERYLKELGLSPRPARTP